MRKSRGKKVRLSGGAVSSQRGIVVPIVAIGLLAILAVAGLALDGSHALGNKTRMQNTVDAAALAAAKVLTLTEKTSEATIAAHRLFSINANGAGNHELNEADITVTVQFSTTVNPFVPGSPDGPFVRVRATGFDTQTTLSRVLGINEIPTPATAVAGPSGPLGSGEGATVCDVAPIAVCNAHTGAGKPAEADPPFGFVTDDLTVLKPGPSDHDAIGPGNYKLLDYPCAKGIGNCLSHNLAGGAVSCETVGKEASTKPGESSGPTSQGFNTRFGIYRPGNMSSDKYPPDRVTTEQGNDVLRACADDNSVEHIYLVAESDSDNQFCEKDEDGNKYDPAADFWKDREVFTADQINYSYDNSYASDSIGGPEDFEAGTEANRRILALPVVDCQGDQNGKSELKVLGVACLFMLQSLPGPTQAGGQGKIIGQFIDGCEVNATPGEDPPATSPFLYKIQLYKDSDSRDS